MLYIGIDPGVGGAIAAVNSKGRLYRIWDTPVTEVKKGKKKQRQYLIASMAELLRSIPQDRIRVVGLELVHAMPKNGSVANFALGRGSGLWEGVVCGVGLPLEHVTPQAWKKELLGQGAGGDKSASIVRAQQVYPQAVKYLTRKKDDGRAEALLIAEYFRRHFSRMNGGGCIMAR